MGSALSTQSVKNQKEILLEVHASLSGDWQKQGWGSEALYQTWEGVVVDESSNGSKVTELDLKNNIVAHEQTNTGQQSGIRNDFPAAVCNLTWLGKLDLEGNCLVNSIPKSIGSLKNLTHLCMRNNLLTGEVPVEITELKKLVFLRMDHNLLIGPIPTEIGQLVHLEFIDFNHNQLSGSLPEQLGQCTKLEKIILGANKLEGEIPDSIGNLTRLKECYLFDNKLSGVLPNSLTNCRELVFFACARNQIEGVLPEPLHNLSKLEFLSLSSNKMSGPLPLFIGGVTSLVGLDLSDNCISGSLPDSIGHLSKLKKLSLCNNQLGGTLPPSVGKCSNLETLYLHNNKFTGIVPDSFSTLQKLKICSLFFNEDGERKLVVDSQLEATLKAAQKSNRSEMQVASALPIIRSPVFSFVQDKLYLVTREEFLEAGKFLRFDEVQKHFIMSQAQVMNFEKTEQQVLFVSHRWEGNEPDDSSNNQYNAVAQIVESLEQVAFCWVDYSSINQDDQAQKIRQIISLPFYVSACRNFCVIPSMSSHSAPEAAGIQYENRAWCRVEFCTFLALLISLNTLLGRPVLDMEYFKLFVATPNEKESATGYKINSGEPVFDTSTIKLGIKRLLSIDSRPLLANSVGDEAGNQEHSIEEFSGFYGTLADTSDQPYISLLWVRLREILSRSGMKGLEVLQQSEGRTNPQQVQAVTLCCGAKTRV